MNAAKKLLQFDFDANTFARQAPKPTAVPSERLAILKQIIRDHDGMGSELPDQESLRQIYDLFLHTHHPIATAFNSLRRTRKLAWALTYSENELPRIVDTPKLQDALQLIDRRFQISMLLGVFNALLETWDTQNTEMLRDFLKRHLIGYTGSRTFVQKLKTNMAWYCEENSPTHLARHLIDSSNKLSDVWTFLELPDYMYRYAYFRAVAIAYTTVKNQLTTEHIADVVDFVKKHNNDKTSRIVLSKLIEKLGIEASESLRHPVQSYALQEWEDPRIAGADNQWREVSDEARKIFTYWITKEDLRFFFHVVAKACGDPKFEYRKAFWLSYLEHISFCRPVLRKNAEHLFHHDPQALQYYQDRCPAELKGGNRNQHAFIIQMGDYTFVEFSTAGACYVYHNANLPFELGDSEYHMTELRSRLCAKDRVIHINSEQYSWQSQLALWVAKQLRINPLRSYRLDGQPNSYLQYTRIAELY